MGSTPSLDLRKPNKYMSVEELQFNRFLVKAKAQITKDHTTASYPTLFKDWNSLFARKQETRDPTQEVPGKVLLIGSTDDFLKGEKPLLACYEDMLTMMQYFTQGNYFQINTIGPLINEGKEVLTKEACLKAITEEINHLAVSNYEHLVIYYSGKAKNGEGWAFKDGFISFKDVLEIWNPVMGNSVDKELMIIVDTDYSGEWCDEISKVYYPCRISVLSTSEARRTCIPRALTGSFGSSLIKDKKIFELIKKKKIIFQAALHPLMKIWHVQDWLYFVDKYVNYHKRTECDEFPAQKPSKKLEPVVIVPMQNTQVEVIEQTVGKVKYVTINAPEGSDIMISENIIKPKCPNNHTLIWSKEVIKCSGCYGHSVGMGCKECNYYLGVECYKGKFDTRKCPNDHKLYWSVTERECAQCQTKSHGMNCLHCQFQLCSHCAKVAIRPDLCPNNHALKWYPTPTKCLRCVGYGNGMCCKACGYNLCTDCADVKLPKTNCLNGHNLHWTIKEHDCLKCKQKLSGKMCPGCDYFLCVNCADVVYEKDKCPNNHPLQINLKEIFCLKCLRKAKGVSCLSCSYNLCSTCFDAK